MTGYETYYTTPQIDPEGYTKIAANRPIKLQHFS